MSGGQEEDSGGKIERGAGQLDAAGGILKPKKKRVRMKTVEEKKPWEK